MAFALAKLLKHLKESLVSTYTLRSVYLMALTEMMDKYGAEEALRKIFRWGYEMGHEYALRLGKDLKRYTNIFKDGLSLEDSVGTHFREMNLK